ncbi:MAG: hypothetical protein ACK5U8_07235 [Deltaproteobacteria bacterium]
MLRASLLMSVLALTSLGCVRETVSCADNPSPACPDAGGPRMDSGPPDAARRPAADLDAPTFFVATPAGGGAARFMQEVDCE